MNGLVDSNIKRTSLVLWTRLTSTGHASQLDFSRVSSLFSIHLLTGGMFTANTMSSVVKTLGLTLPGAV